MSDEFEERSKVFLSGLHLKHQVEDGLRVFLIIAVGGLVLQ